MTTSELIRCTTIFMYIVFNDKNTSINLYLWKDNENQ